MKSKEYVYYVPSKDQLYVAKHKDLDTIYVEDQPVKCLFPWVEDTITLKIYARCYYVGVL